MKFKIIFAGFYFLQAINTQATIKFITDKCSFLFSKCYCCALTFRNGICLTFKAFLTSWTVFIGFCHSGLKGAYFSIMTPSNLFLSIQNSRYSDLSSLPIFSLWMLKLLIVTLTLILFSSN